MLNLEIKLNSNFEKNSYKASRDGFGEGLVIAGEKNKNVVALTADVCESLRMHWFKDKFPLRFIELGIAEQNMVGVASGLASCGKIPVVASYAVFSPGRNWEQIRTTICYNEQKIILVGSHGGLNVGPDGATHQALEDIALTRVLPFMSVVVPCDAIEAKKAILKAIDYPTAVYIRLAREKSPIITTEETPFEIGKSQVFWLPKENFSGITVLACGFLVHQALFAAKELEEEGIEICVINNSAIKPLDKELILEWAEKSKAFITLEEHQAAGGMGSTIAEFIAENHPLPIYFMGVNDSFGESGEALELIKKFGLDKDSLKKKVKEIIKKI